MDMTIYSYKQEQNTKGNYHKSRWMKAGMASLPEQAFRLVWKLRNQIQNHKRRQEESGRPSPGFYIGCFLHRYPRFTLYAIAAVIASIICCIAVCSNGPALNAQADHVNQKYYTAIEVEAGDTLWDIAQEYRTAEYPSTMAYVEEVKEINHIVGDDITAGCYLTIPYYAEAPME